jgi:integrase
MTKRGRYGDGSLDERGPDIWRLRYRTTGGRRISQTFRGSKRDAQKELRRLIRTNDTGEAVLPDKITVAQWTERWIAAGAPGRRQKQIRKRSAERYGEALRCHVVPTLGSRTLQTLRADEIDALYTTLRGKIAERSIVFVHVVLGACIAAAVRQRLLPASPMKYLSKVPSAPEGDQDHGVALDPEQTRKLIAGFRGHPLYPLVVTALSTGARRNELLALRWSDLDVAARTLRIERSLERTRSGLAIKGPKTRRGMRTITIDDELLGLLIAERERHQQIAAGVPDGAAVDLSLVKLPEGALIFPGTPQGSSGFNFTAFRNPSSVTGVFLRVARKLGFPLRFHDLRGTSVTRMLNRGVPPHIVAKRHGHDIATMMKAYAKSLPQDDAAAAAVMGDMLKGVL